MKILMIGNCVYFPIQDTNKYVAGSINGNVFLNDIKTREEIIESHDNRPIKECEHLHDVCKQWGTRD